MKSMEERRGESSPSSAASGVGHFSLTFFSHLLCTTYYREKGGKSENDWTNRAFFLILLHPVMMMMKIIPDHGTALQDILLLKKCDRRDLICTCAIFLSRN